jgi:DNA-3-methyladenine glycosylase
VTRKRLPGKLLREEFFLRPPELVARELLGKLLVRAEDDGTVLAGRIVETEAYFGDEDPASHAYRRRTARNAAMFGPPGRAYVYLIYGMHECVNAVCGMEGDPSAVLIRALEPVLGREHMAAARGLDADCKDKLIAGGPARLAEALGITRARDYGKSMVDDVSDLQLRDDKYLVQGVLVSRRIGITKGADLELRFCIAGHGCVSR